MFRANQKINIERSILTFYILNKKLVFLAFINLMNEQYKLNSK